MELTRDEQAEGAIKIRKRITGADLGIKNFLDYFGIVPKKTSMYEIEQLCVRATSSRAIGSCW